MFKTYNEKLIDAMFHSFTRLYLLVLKVIGYKSLSYAITTIIMLTAVYVPALFISLYIFDVEYALISFIVFAMCYGFLMEKATDKFFELKI